MGFRSERWDIRVAGIDVGIAATRRPGEREPVVFLHGFGSTKEDYLDIARMRRSPFSSSALYAASLRHKVRARAVQRIFTSMVELSDHGDLMNKFLALPFPRMFMYGEQNASLTYLPLLRANGVELAEIPHSGHFPMYSNPPVMWAKMADFQARRDDHRDGRPRRAG